MYFYRRLLELLASKTMKIKDVRNYISDACLEHVKRGTGNLIFNTFTGSGKTTTVLKTIYEDSDGLNWMYFAPYHKVIEENLELSKVIDFQGFIHLESRAKLCLSLDRYKPLAEQGINITPFCENFCALKETRCLYYENLRSLREMPTCIAAVHAHIPTLMQRLFYERWERRPYFSYYDVIVIDEFPSNSLYNQISINKYNITYAGDILQMVNINSDESRVLTLLLNELYRGMETGSVNYARIYNMIEQYRGLNFDEFKQSYDERILDLITRGRIQSPPKDIIYFLIEFWNNRPNIPQLRWMIKKTERDQWHNGNLYLTVSNIRFFQSLPVKVVALDGTANLDTWRSVLGNDSESISFDIAYKNIYQMLGARNPISTIVRKGLFTSSGDKLYDILLSICRSKESGVIVCASKRVQRILRAKLKKDEIKNVEYASFYNLRSRNSYYENCDTCVIFHEPNIPPFQSEIIKNVLGWDEAIIIKLHREDEMRQGIGRLRQNIPTSPKGRKRGIREIFIFPSTSNKKIVPEVEYMLYQDMLGYARGGKKRVFFGRLKDLIKNHSPMPKTTLAKVLGLSSQKITFLLDALEREGVVKLEWGKIKWLRDITQDEEEKYIITIGFNR